MKKKWKKLGLLYCPPITKQHPKLLTHAANPLPVLIEKDLYRIFFNARDLDNRSSVGAVDIDIVQRKVIQEYNYPFFEYGPEGSFYANGVSIGNCYQVKGIQYILFMGWQTPEKEHWRGNIGRLILNSNLTLELDRPEPFIGIDDTDPISLSYPWVLEHSTNNYSMWYGSTKSWNIGNGSMLHTINYASSSTGHLWIKHGLAIPYKIGEAQAFSRPTVIGNLEIGYEMWFSYRNDIDKTYRIGYALSSDGKEWKLDLDNPDIDVSSSGWDSEMIEYPFVFDHKGNRYMLYNGNGYGKTGFGIAILDNP